MLIFKNTMSILLENSDFEERNQFPSNVEIKKIFNNNNNNIYKSDISEKSNKSNREYLISISHKFQKSSIFRAEKSIIVFLESSKYKVLLLTITITVTILFL